MTTVLKKYAGTSVGAFAARSMYPGAPQIMFAPEGTGGSGGDGDGNGDGNGSGDGSGSDDGDGNGDGKGADDGKGDGKGKGSEADDKNKGKTDDEKAALLREVMEKKSTITELKDQLKKFEGIDPDAVRALLEEKRQAELAAEEAKGNFDRVKQMIVEAHETEKKTLSDRIAELEGKLTEKDGELDKLTVGQSFALSTYINEELTLTPSKAKKIYGDHFERVDGKVVAYDKPAGASDRTVLTGADGQPLSFEDAMRKIIEADPEKDRLIKQKIAPGASSSSKKVDPSAKTEGQAEKRIYGVSRIAIGLEKGK